MATRKQSRKNTVVAQTGLVAVSGVDQHYAWDQPIDTRHALIPVSGVMTRMESTGRVIIDADPDPIAQTTADMIAEHPDLVRIDPEQMHVNVAQTTVGYVRNAARATYARYLVKLGSTLLAAYNAGQTAYPDGSPVLYRVADVATQFVALYKKLGKLPAADLESTNMRAMLADVTNPAHHAKCLIAAGLFNSADLPAAILWDAARKQPFYALPNTPDMPFLSLVYGDETGHGGAFNHQLASDFLSRLAPSYVTPILYAYVRDLNITNKTALHRFLRAYLDASRDNLPITDCYDRACDAADLVLISPVQSSKIAVGHMARIH